MASDETLGSTGIRYPVESNEDPSFSASKCEILTREGASTHQFNNCEILKTKRPIASWDPSLLWLPKTEKIQLPTRSLRRLRAWHPAIQGTAQQYAGRLVKIIPELAGVTDEDIDKALRHVRKKE